MDLCEADLHTPHHLQDVRLLGLFRDITLHRGQVQSARVLVQGSPGGPHDTRRYHVHSRHGISGCQYTVKKCKISFTLLTSILPFATILIDMRLT
jgi:hypothetical protein